MRAVLLEVPEAMLAGRCRLGLDERDEVWNGVLHMASPAGGPHQRLGTQLSRVLGPLVRGRRDLRENRLLRRSDVLGAQFITVEGRLRITWEDGVADV